MSVPHNALTVEVIEHGERLAELRPQWAELWRSDPAATPFQSPDWLLPWWKHVGDGALLSVAIHHGPLLAALLPAYVYTNPGSGSRQLLLLGAGTSDYLGGVFHPELATPAAELCIVALAAHREQWDESWLSQLPELSPLLRLAASGLAPVPTEPCMIARIPPAGRVTGKLRENLRYYRKRADRLGTLRFSTATGDTASAFFELLADLHAARWTSRGESGVLANPGVLAAHRESVPLLAARGLLRLHALSIDDRPAAVFYGLIDAGGRPQRSLYCYLTGFAPEFRDVSPGTLLLGYAVEQAAADGATVLDMLRGQEAYKRFWRGQPQPTFGFAIPRDQPLDCASAASEEALQHA
jgi:CelD/BcsL family acetyltransferase involved in cellulose biosynthesis